MAEVETKSLPENAYEPLKPGELYPPIVAAAECLPELTIRSIGWGILFCIIFTVASAYSGLKVGQVMESAIPISILAIGLARLYPRRSSLLENVIITGIGGVAGSVVAGAVFMRLRRPGFVTVILAEIIVLARCAAEVNSVRFVGALVVPFPEQSDGVLHNDAFYFRAFKT